jgi:hypothetical protein
MDFRSKVTAHKADRLLEATQEPLPHISLNMVVCLNSKDLNQPDRWLTSNLQASFLVSKVDTVDHQLNLLVNTQVNKWVATEVLPALGGMVVAHQHQLLSGVHQRPKALAAASRVTKAELTIFYGFCSLY